MNSEFESLEFKIHGMDCAEEVAVLKRGWGRGSAVKNGSHSTFSTAS